MAAQSGQTTLAALEDTMLKLKADQERLGGSTGMSSPRKEWTYTQPPEPECPMNTSLVQVLVGPIIGTVTQTSAVVLLEVDASAAVTLVVQQQGGQESVIRMQRRLPARRPVTFTVVGLRPASVYSISFEGLATTELQGLDSQIVTLPFEDDITALRILAFSGDRPDVVDHRREENPWIRMANMPAVSSDAVTLCLHLGGQVHASFNGALQRTRRLMKDHDNAHEALATKMRDRVVERFQDSYRDAWSEEPTRVVMAKWQRMIAWSDVDIADEFTTLRTDGGQQAYHPEFLRCSMRCYRMYQRQLWDPDCEGALPPARHPVEEWQFRTFGPFGVFILDLRGNRVSSTGKVAEAPLLSDRQRTSISAALATPGLSGLIFGSELPLAYHEPAGLRKLLEEDPSQVFLKDHWAYHTEDLFWLLDTVFDWRQLVPGREVIFLCGGINCGVDTSICDKRTGAMIRQVTASPLTSFVAPFEAPTSGELSMRYYFLHKALPQQRNYCQLSASIVGDTCTMVPELVGFPTQGLSMQDKVGIESSQQ